MVVLEPGKVPRELGAVDVVLPLLHGPYGEDGTMQGLLELAGVRYVGSGVLRLRGRHGQGAHEGAVRRRRTADRPVRRGHPAVEWATDPAAVRETVAGLGYPVFVKPCRAGSSVGITKVTEPGELDAAIELARSHDPRVIVEAARRRPRDRVRRAGGRRRRRARRRASRARSS